MKNIRNRTVFADLIWFVLVSSWTGKRFFRMQKVAYDSVRFLSAGCTPAVWGLGIRFRALNEFTASLPLVKCSMEHGYVGKNTHDAILNGVMNGILFEVRGYIDELLRNNPFAVVIITGGGSEYLKKTLKRTVFFEDKLVITGLNRILEYQKTVNYT